MLDKENLAQSRVKKLGNTPEGAYNQRCVRFTVSVNRLTLG